MIIKPPSTKQMATRPFALVTPGHRHVVIETLDGVTTARGADKCYEALQAVEGHTLYTPGRITALRHITGATYWAASTWRGRATSMKMDGTKVSVKSLRGTLEGCPDPFGELMRMLGWVDGYGVRPSGISGMGWALWRSTLVEPVDLSAKPSIGRAALYGGRQQVSEARTYQHMAAVDITGAYPHAMASAPYALGLRRVSPGTVLDPSTPGIARASVRFAQMPYGPLPERLATDLIRFPTGGLVEGHWTWRELAAAADLGADVRVERCWAPTALVDLFDPSWTALVAEGRGLGGGAAKLAKACLNSVWGMFGMSGDDKGVTRWADLSGYDPVRVALPPSKLPHAATSYIAAETASRVRVRMLREGLYGDWASPVHVDTDGVIVRKSSVASVPTSDGPPGAWRVKSIMPKVEIRAPQVYRHSCPECDQGIDAQLARPRQTHPEWHYVTSGVPTAQARELFTRMGRGTKVSFNGIDIVLPGDHAQDKEATRRAVREARSVIGGMAE